MCSEVMDSSPSASSRFPVASIGEPLIWLLPVALAVWGHIAASIKVGMPFIIENARTDFAESMWHLMSENTWVFIVYGVFLMGVSLLVRRLHFPRVDRFAILCAVAIPPLWYFGESAYLLGKFID